MKSFNIEDTLSHKLIKLSILQKRLVFQMLAEKNLDITPEQGYVLFLLWTRGSCLLKDLAKATQKDNGNITRIVSKLEKLNYVEKGDHPCDKRSAIVSLKPTALPIVEKWFEIMERLQKIVLKNISQEDQETFGKVLSLMHNNIMSEEDYNL